MGESKHTPGPWRVREMVRHGQLHGYFVAANDVNGFAYDAEILGEDEYRDGLGRWAADANLIAAAPELLEALIDAGLQITYLHEKLGSDTGTGNASLARIRAAIAKAEGTPTPNSTTLLSAVSAKGE